MALMLANPGQGQLLEDVEIPILDGNGDPTSSNHPQVVDVYIPQLDWTENINTVLTLLHGGGGDKKSVARAAGLINNLSIFGSSSVLWASLRIFRAIAIIPQGSACLTSNTGPFNPNGVDTISAEYPDGVRTWSNDFMWSGADDVKFLTDLSEWIKTNYAGTRRILAGHSNGGMMVMKMWLEHMAAYNCYASVCGPLNNAYFSSAIDAISGDPTVRRPLYQRYATGDTILGIKDGIVGPGDHFADPLWSQQPQQLSVANVDPGLAQYIPGWKVLDELSQSAGEGAIDLQNPGTLYTKFTYTTGGVIYNLGDLWAVEAQYSTGPQGQQILGSARHVVELIKSNSEHDMISHAVESRIWLIYDWLDFNLKTFDRGFGYE